MYYVVIYQVLVQVRSVQQDQDSHIFSYILKFAYLKRWLPDSNNLDTKCKLHKFDCSLFHSTIQLNLGLLGSVPGCQHTGMKRFRYSNRAVNAKTVTIFQQCRDSTAIWYNLCRAAVGFYLFYFIYFLFILVLTRKSKLFGLYIVVKILYFVWEDSIYCILQITELHLTMKLLNIIPTSKTQLIVHIKNCKLLKPPYLVCCTT